MNFFRRILTHFDGLKFHQEYLCLAKESFQFTLHVYLVDNNRILNDLTHSHQFIGYCPLILSIPASEIPDSLRNSPIELIFSKQPFQQNEVFEKKDAIALLKLKMINNQSAGKSSIILYEGVSGNHKLLSAFSKFIIGLDNNLYNKKPGNVFLHNNLYKQVQIAYSIPRIISLISVKKGELYNLFPTDLHGPLNDQYYISSLRHEGKACKQVESARKIIISTVHCQSYKMAYGLGKNHMQDLKPSKNFPFGSRVSKNFQIPIPETALSYHELEIEDSFIHGIHKIFLYKIIAKEVISSEPATLAHIHNAFATWRHNKGLSGNYLLR